MVAVGGAVAALWQRSQQRSGVRVPVSEQRGQAGRIIRSAITAIASHFRTSTNLALWVISTSAAAFFWWCRLRSRSRICA
jgi:hypothetical protein